MSASFDSASSDYDEDFTNSQIGKYQRDAIWKYLDEVLPSRQLQVLELNAGTGEDAMKLAQKGHEVLVTDVSDEMLDVAKSKLSNHNLLDKVRFKKVDLSKEFQFEEDEKFDLIFSNFAGLNCIDKSDLEQVLKSCHDLLSPNGELIFVFLGKFCFWESLYFLAKGDFQKAFRRNSDEPVIADVSGEKVATWYYSPSNIKELINGNYNQVSTKAIGTFIPPSYLNNLFAGNSTSLKFLNTLEESVGALSVFSNLSDHYLIHLKKQ